MLARSLDGSRGAGHQGFDFLDVERFGEIVEGAEFHGLDGVFHGRLAGDDGHEQVGMRGKLISKEGQPIVARQIDVHQGEIHRFFFQQPGCLLRRFREMEVVP